MPGEDASAYAWTCAWMCAWICAWICAWTSVFFKFVGEDICRKCMSEKDFLEIGMVLCDATSSGCDVRCYQIISRLPMKMYCNNSKPMKYLILTMKPY